MYNGSMKITKIISGGQTGADVAGLDAAIAKNIEHGGYCPKGRRTENGTIDDVYNLTETATSGYLERTELNVVNADITLIFTYGKPTGGSSRTVGFCIEHDKPFICINLDDLVPSFFFVERIERELDQLNKEEVVINVAGSRESKAPGIWEITKDIMEGLIDSVNKVA